MYGTRTTESIHNKISRVVSGLHNRLANKVRCLSVLHFEDSERGLLQRHVERRTDFFFQRSRCQVSVDWHSSAKEEVFIQDAEHEVRIGHGGTTASSPVTGGSRSRSRAPRSHSKTLVSVDPCESTPAASNRAYVHGRHVNRVLPEYGRAREDRSALHY